jgi:hypothetical protein
MSVTLPAPLTRFVGREAELAEAAALLGEARLLTLTGPGGAGKTRLAVRLAASVTEDFPDGVWFIDFSPLPGGEFVWDEVANTLGVNAPGPGTANDARLAGAVRCLGRLTPKSLATSVTVRPSAITARTALYLCSATLISLMPGSVKNQPK